MKRLTFTAAALAAILTALLLARSGAQDAAPADTVPADKWQAIDDNHKKMMQALDVIERNLNFAKARSTSGGRQSP